MKKFAISFLFLWLCLSTPIVSASYSQSLDYNLRLHAFSSGLDNFKKELVHWMENSTFNINEMLYSKDKFSNRGYRQNLLYIATTTSTASYEKMEYLIKEKGADVNVFSDYSFSLGDREYNKQTPLHALVDLKNVPYRKNDKIKCYNKIKLLLSSGYNLSLKRTVEITLSKPISLGLSKEFYTTKQETVEDILNRKLEETQQAIKEKWEGKDYGGTLSFYKNVKKIIEEYKQHTHIAKSSPFPKEEEKDNDFDEEEPCNNALETTPIFTVSREAKVKSLEKHVQDYFISLFSEAFIAHLENTHNPPAKELAKEIIGKYAENDFTLDGLVNDEFGSDDPVMIQDTEAYGWIINDDNETTQNVKSTLVKNAVLIAAVVKALQQVQQKLQGKFQFKD